MITLNQILQRYIFKAILLIGLITSVYISWFMYNDIAKPLIFTDKPLVQKKSSIPQQKINAVLDALGKKSSATVSLEGVNNPFAIKSTVTNDETPQLR